MEQKEILTAELPYNMDEEPLYAKEYESVRSYAEAKGLVNTLTALPVVRSLHDGLYRGDICRSDGTLVKRPYIMHCLAVCKMLINLKLALTQQEEDIAMAAALCHDLPAFVPEVRHTYRLTEVYHIDREVVDLVELIYTRDCETESDFDELFERVSENKLAMLVKLADRGNVVETLYNSNAWKANEYIHETKTYYIPMCIRVREHYPELDRTMGILQEKLRQTIEACEYFFERYMSIENELSARILQLTEDNARMRIRIRKWEAQKDL